MTEQIDLDDFFIDDSFFLDLEPPVLSDSPSPPAGEIFSNSPPESVSSWIGQIESLLMNDDDDQDHQIALESDQRQPIADFLADVLVDSPADGSGKESDNISNDPRNESPEKETVDVDADADGSVDKESDASGDSGNGSPEKESANRAEAEGDGDEDADDPVAKKRRRQLRNRDAAVRSRERKKMHLKDLEMKSKYLERECMRLGRLLQCCVAENQALRLCLQKGGSAYDASMTKQESAVLLRESLLLGSLLWFLGIMCLFNPPKLPPSPLGSIPPEIVEKNDPESEAPRGRGSKTSTSFVGECFVKSRKCKASRTRMKLNPDGLKVSA